MRPSPAKAVTPKSKEVQTARKIPSPKVLQGSEDGNSTL